MHQHFLRFFVLVAGLFAIVLNGCNNPDARYTRVEGIVTYQQQPVEGATVTFLPVGTGTESEPAAGATNASGKFLLSSSRSVKGGSGVLPGEYDVLITKTTFTPDPDVQAYEAGTITYDELLTRRSKKDRSKEEPSTNHLPVKYSQRNNSGLSAKVTKGKKS